MSDHVTELSGIQDIQVTEEEVRKHVIRPAHVLLAQSDRGREDGDLRLLAHLHSHRHGHHLDVTAFGAALDAALQNFAAGYVMGLNQHGKRILTQHHNWAHTPSDGSERWKTDVAMH